ncbi:MAG: paraquat-inducible membrane protein A [Epsilonproteobacteria bacterium]|nr:paraquat-inducible membrane protein A [Campylobacterota bacterium]
MGAKILKYKRCLHCGAVNYYQDEVCRRCEGDIRLDKKRAISTSLAFLLSAIFFYIPANLFPILNTSKFAQTQGSTIIGGVIELWKEGDYPVAIIIFLASVLIPIIKFFVLFYLLYAVYKGSCESGKVKLYHIMEIMGPWSLIDVFVVMVLVGLIHFNSVSVIPGVGATSFALMVLFTILSAKALDPRLIGEECE